MKRHAVAVARQGDIGAVAIQARRREEMGAVDGYPLRLVDRRRVAMIEIAIIFDVECDAAPVINANRHALFADPLARPERAILHLQAARSEEHTSELQSLMRISCAVFCFKKKRELISYT